MILLEVNGLLMLASAAARHGKEIVKVVLDDAAARPFLCALVEHGWVLVVHTGGLRVIFEQEVRLAAIMAASPISLW